MNRINASIYKLALFLGVILAYVVVNDVHVGFWVDTPHASTAVTFDSTPGKDIFNNDAHLDNSQIDYSSTVTDTADPNVTVTDNGDESLTLQIIDEDAPSEMWDALIRMGYRGNPADGCECLTVPDGLIVDAPTYSYTIAHDGIRVEGPENNEDK